MGLFSKKKSAGSDKGKAPEAEEQKPKERQMYMPRYAARDGLIGAPGGMKEAEQEAFARAYKTRESREMNGSTWSLPDPRTSPRLSRNSSAMSLDMIMAGTSNRMSNPFATPNGGMGGSRPGSYQGVSYFSQEPPVPSIPQQYASSSGSRPTSAQGRNSAFYNQPQQSSSSSPMNARPRVSQQRQSFMATSPLARTPEISYENTPDDTPDVSTRAHSSSASSASSSSGEVMEIATKAESPAQYMIDSRAYPNDPRRHDSGASTPRSYFAHSSKPEMPAVPMATAAPPMKKKRFSLGRKSTPAAVAAH